MSPRGRLGRAAIWLALGVAAAACTSPEATRQRAGGPGADSGNRRGTVQMHEGAEPYWKTPRRLAEHRRAPSAAARQADPAASPGGTGK